MMKLLVFFSILLLPLTASAGEYSCLAKANSAIGFDDDIAVTVSPAAHGGIIAGDEGGGQVAIGLVDAINTYSSGPQFHLILALFGSPETSGLKAPESITRIVKYSSHPIDSDESSVIRYFQGARQVGGTFVLRGDAIACLPE